jgi:hypothetical protein
MDDAERIFMEEVKAFVQSMHGYFPFLYFSSSNFHEGKRDESGRWMDKEYEMEGTKRKWG